LCDAGKSCGVESVCLYGGTSKQPQISALKSGIVSHQVLPFLLLVCILSDASYGYILVYFHIYGAFFSPSYFIDN